MKLSKDQMKKEICRVIDENRERIISLAEELYRNPELGYKEVFATKKVVEQFHHLNLEVQDEIAITGCSGKISEGKGGPNIVVMGELDSVICQEHPHANQEGAIHACGHNNQIAAMVGSAIGLIKSDAYKELDGRVTFMAVPAEEFIELNYRSKLMEEGKIKYMGGKQELIHRGYFDDADIAMMIHSLDTSSSGKKVMIGSSGNGFIGKRIQFLGKESHAGGAPEKGVNALNAAMLAINNIHAQRETFADDDHIRVHPIITKGGDIVNIVPADVRMESYVRGRNIEGIEDANKKVNRSLIAGAIAVGAKVNITEIPGYFPLLAYNPLDEIFYNNAKEFVAEEEIQRGGELGGSFDMGDLSHIMPTLHPFVGGVKGDLHTREFRLENAELAYIIPAKIMAMTIVDLLYDGAEEAKKIIKNCKPPMSKDEYLKFQEEKSKTITAP